MPELPEVHKFASLFAPLVGKKITDVETPSPVQPKTFPSSDSINWIVGSTLQSVERKGKLMRLTLKKGADERFCYMHMMMTGRISSPDCVVPLESIKDTAYPPPHTHLVFKAKSIEACYSDPRRFGTVVLTTETRGFDILAPDALDLSSESVMEDAVPKLTDQPKGTKELLLDQNRAISGVGNWIADEICYQTSLHPDQNYLTAQEARAVLEKAREVCETAVECGASESDISNYPKDWMFHYRWTKASPKDAHGRNISFVTSGGRTSAIVASLQTKQGRKRAAASAGEQGDAGDDTSAKKKAKKKTGGKTKS
jgi:formamidopyrimidine-DNA glycosylase